MIYPDVTLEEWLEKYPDLSTKTGICDNCGDLLIANRPFIEKEYVGLDSFPCDCGKNRHKCMTMIPTTKEEIERWQDLLGIGE